VHTKIENAKKQSKTLDLVERSVFVDGWYTYVTCCPICNSDGVLVGTTEDCFEYDMDGNPEGGGLAFFADSFECDMCGLKLDDVEELRLAGMETDYDRSDEHDRWLEEKSAEYDYAYDYPEEDRDSS